MPRELSRYTPPGCSQYHRSQGIKTNAQHRGDTFISYGVQPMMARGELGAHFML